jgi:membrane fusion protein (multidrug efflux system)
MLRSDRGWMSVVGIGVAVLLGVGWIGWLFAARVTLHELSAAARLEAKAAPHAVASPFAARVAVVHASLGQEVAEGALLLELDTTALRGQLAQQRARRSAVEAQIPALEQEVATRSAALPDSRGAAAARVTEAGARLREVQVAADLSRSEESRTESIRREGVVAASEMARAAADARMKEMGVRAQRNVVRRLEAEGRSSVSALEAELSGLAGRLAALRGELAALRAEDALLVEEIERRRIRAPVAGRIGAIAELRPGGFLDEGDPIATVVPGGDLRVVAEFPLSSVGRLTVGQPATMRLDAFPWVEYGSARATVVSIGTEAQGGRVRVELALTGAQPAALRLQHGLSGQVDVETEEVSPGVLILRAAGKAFHRVEGAP